MVGYALQKENTAFHKIFEFKFLMLMIFRSHATAESLPESVVFDEGSAAKVIRVFLCYDSKGDRRYFAPHRLSLHL